ncbi:MAG: periplasmic divalent cation tolerance protein [Hyphomicrobiaceae bacterium]|jgi:periplasmic divalent cation tolerance protein
MSQIDDTALVVLTTVGSVDEGATIARKLVEERAAACVSRLPVTSTYRWDGAVQEDGEFLLLIKTRAGNWHRVCERVRELHSYEVPELVALEASDVDGGYLAWLLEASSEIAGEA